MSMYLLLIRILGLALLAIYGILLLIGAALCLAQETILYFQAAHQIQPAMILLPEPILIQLPFQEAVIL